MSKQMSKMMDANRLRGAIDGVWNPFSSTSDEQERTVLEAAEQLAEVIDILNIPDEEFGGYNEWGSAMRENMIRDALGDA